MDWTAFIHELHLPLSLTMLSLFSLIVLWTYAPKRRELHRENALIPLKDDER